MATLFKDPTYEAVIDGLRAVGYQGSLLEENYAFRDYFSPHNPERRLAAATFGQTPPDYESACIGVALSNGHREQELINTLRALGAPVVLEVDNYEVREWAVSRTPDQHALVARYPTDRVRQMIESRASDWKPSQFLRAKNIGSFHWAPQLGLFTGLLPELEDQIQKSLEPLIHDALASTRSTYREITGSYPDPARLFKLIFWILTAKVFRDRKVNGFKTLGADPDDILNAVARRYEEEPPRLLNRQSREVAVSRIWHELDFRNLSVEVLAQMWSSMLIDDQTKRRLRIHRTPRTIVRYIIERIPFEQVGDDKLTVLEPCCGSAVFLIGALNVLRSRFWGAPPEERHRYLTRRLVGIEKDPFGVEISKLALTLADFPNPGGWNVIEGDVFEEDVLPQHLSGAGVVLCNPPFGSFDEDEQDCYSITSKQKPVDLLNRVLDNLHPLGVLGFVMPRVLVDGRAYSKIRQRLVERFETIDLLILPDKVFEADAESCLLVAKDPIPHQTCRIVSRKVQDTRQAWQEFELKHKVSSDHVVLLRTEDAANAFVLPDLPELWDALRNHKLLDSVAELHRGIEWNKPLEGNRQKLVRYEPTRWFLPGIEPQTSFDVFQTPPSCYLNALPKDQRRNSYKHPWHLPKAILYKFARSRGHWRMAAFADAVGLACPSTYIGVWPKPVASDWDEWLLAAVLNSPLANAFVATREGKYEVSLETLKLLPMPYFSTEQRERLRRLIREYRASTASPVIDRTNDPERLLMEIDALVLDGYQLTPKLEHTLLKYFIGQGQNRATPHPFGDYIPADCEVYFSLSQHLSPTFNAASAGEMRKRMGLN
jgi:hypothetical protein